MREFKFKGTSIFKLTKYSLLIKCQLQKIIRSALIIYLKKIIQQSDLVLIEKVYTGNITNLKLEKKS